MSGSMPFKFPGTTSTAPSKKASKASLIVRFYDPNVRARDAHSRTKEEILTWPDTKLESCHNYIQMLFPVPEGSSFSWEAPIIDRETMDAFRSRSDLRERLRQSFNRMLDFYGFEMKVKSTQVEEKEKTKIEDATAEQETENITPTPDEPRDFKAEEATDSMGKDPEPQAKAPSSFPAGAHSNNTATLDYEVVRNSHWSRSFNGWAVRFDHNHLRITRILRCLRILGLQTECDAFYAALKEVYEDPMFKISDRSMQYWTRAVTRPLYIAPDDERIEWLKVWEKEQDAKEAGKEAGGDSKDSGDVDVKEELTE